MKTEHKFCVTGHSSFTNAHGKEYAICLNTDFDFPGSLTVYEETVICLIYKIKAQCHVQKQMLLPQFSASLNPFADVELTLK
jgi:hypothetical protein